MERAKLLDAGAKNLLGRGRVRRCRRGSHRYPVPVLWLEEREVAPLVLALFPLAIGYWLLRSTWNKSRHMSVPGPTNVDLAVDFTPLIALPYEPIWRAYQFRSRLYANLFRKANHLQVWNQHSPEAQSAAVKRLRDSSWTNRIIGADVLAILLWWLWREGLSQFLKTYKK